LTVRRVFDRVVALMIDKIVSPLSRMLVFSKRKLASAYADSSAKSSLTRIQVTDDPG
jgi:hypothetical protein